MFVGGKSRFRAKHQLTFNPQPHFSLPFPFLLTLTLIPLPLIPFLPFSPNFPSLPVQSKEYTYILSSKFLFFEMTPTNEEIHVTLG